MPELPEVETLRRQLTTIVLERRICKVEILDSKLGSIPEISGSKIKAVLRQGKELGFLLEGGRQLKIHLRMTGRLLWQEAGADLPQYCRASIELAGGRIALLDPRRFATLRLVDVSAPVDSRIVDASENPNPAILKEMAQKRRSPLKLFILDQKVMPGMGNIYACEILHHAGLDPRRPCLSLLLPEWEKITAAASYILSRAISCRGTTFSDWRDIFGARGENQDHLQVYGRAGLACRSCGALVQRIKLGGRGTFFCPECQR